MIDTYIWALLACVVSCYFWVIGNRFKSENLELKKELEDEAEKIEMIATSIGGKVCFQLSQRFDDEVHNLR